MAPRPSPPRRPAGAPSLGERLARPFRTYAGVFRDPSVGRGEKALHAAGGLAILGALLVLGLVLYTAALIPLTPSPSELRRQAAQRPSLVLSAEGHKLAQFEHANRAWLPLDSVSTAFLDALLATEDRRFYEHGGVDWRRLATAGLRTLAGRPQGGSTLTQQLARNLYPEEVGREVSLGRKLREIITAIKIERAQEKERILEAYVNTVPFLYNAFGIERAARTYFNTSAAELSVLQAATLVGMLKGTSYYNPVRSPERARARRNVVLRQMVRAGTLEAAEAERLAQEPLGLDFERQEGPESRAPHFTRYVRHWLSEWADRHGHDLEADGLVIHTTLRWDLQQLAERAVREAGAGLQAVADVEWSRAAMPRLGEGFAPYEAARERAEPFAYWWQTHPEAVARYVRASEAFKQGREAGLAEAALLDSLRADEAFMRELRARRTRLEIGFTAIEPRTGRLLAWVGSRDFRATPYDQVYRARRQPGSTFKPFVYAAALTRGFLPGDVFPDEPLEIPVGRGRLWRPANAGGGYSHRELTLAEGLAYSKNTITAQVMMEVGPARVAELARSLGVRQSELDAVPALALGTSSVTLLEMVSAYATLAAGGRYREPLPVARIEDRRGRLLAEFESPSERVLSDDVAQTVVAMLRAAVERGTGRRIRGQFGLRLDVAGKTGTTQGNADGWFVLMHPSLVAGARVGFPEPRVAFRSNYWGQGAHNALLVVGQFFQDAEGLLPDERFPTPARYQEPGAILARADRFSDTLDVPSSGFEADTAFQRWWEEWGIETEDGEMEEDEVEEGEARPYPEESAVQRLYERTGEAPPPGDG